MKRVIGGWQCDPHCNTPELRRPSPSLTELYGGLRDLRAENALLRVAATRAAAAIAWLQTVLTSTTPNTEIFLAGLRRGDEPASSFQVEIAPASQPWKSFRGETLIDAIEAARDARQEPDT